MRVVVYSCRSFEEPFLIQKNEELGHDLVLVKDSLCEATVSLAAGARAVSVIPQDDLEPKILEGLAAGGTEILAIRSVSTTSVDEDCAARAGLQTFSVDLVPAFIYAEYIVTLLLYAGRGLGRVREEVASMRTFPGRSLYGKHVLLIGDDEVARETEQLLSHFNCQLTLFDPTQRTDVLAVKAELWRLLPQSDVVVVHCAQNEKTEGLLAEDTLAHFKPGAVLVSTGWTTFIDFMALSRALASGDIASLAMDVRESGYFMNQIAAKPQLASLLNNPDVFISFDQASHTLYAVKEAVEQILSKLKEWE